MYAHIHTNTYTCFELVKKQHIIESMHTYIHIYTLRLYTYIRTYCTNIRCTSIHTYNYLYVSLRQNSLCNFYSSYQLIAEDNLIEP